MSREPSLDTLIGCKWYQWKGRDLNRTDLTADNRVVIKGLGKYQVNKGTLVGDLRVNPEGSSIPDRSCNQNNTIRNLHYRLQNDCEMALVICPGGIRIYRGVFAFCW